MNMSEIMSTSSSAWAIFISEDILGWPPKRNDIVKDVWIKKMELNLR